MVNDLPAASRTRVGVSVIIPSHNRPALLKEALSSVLAQAVLPAEIIIVDDASDPLVSLPASRNAVPLRLPHHEQTRGGAAAKNTGAKAAQHGLLAFLDDDGLWAPTYLEHASAQLARRADIDVLFMWSTGSSGIPKIRPAELFAGHEQSPGQG